MDCNRNLDFIFSIIHEIFLQMISAAIFWYDCGMDYSGQEEVFGLQSTQCMFAEQSIMLYGVLHLFQQS